MCLSFVSAMAFAQMDPHTGSPEKFSQKDQQDVLTSVADKMSGHNGLEDEFHKMEVAVQRKVAQAKAETKAPTVQPLTSWPHEDGITDTALSATSDRPSYYAEEEAYKNCDGVDVCRMWAREQAQKDVHFQVLSVSISVPDYHNRRVEVAYVMENGEAKLVFEENFGNWNKLD